MGEVCDNKAYAIKTIKYMAYILVSVVTQYNGH